MRKDQAIYICSPSYAFSGSSADGDPIRKIKSCFWAPCGKKYNSGSKALDFNNHSANNADIDLYLWYLSVRSEQAEEGARSFLL